MLVRMLPMSNTITSSTIVNPERCRFIAARGNRWPDIRHRVHFPGGAHQSNTHPSRGVVTLDLVRPDNRHPHALLANPLVLIWSGESRTSVWPAPHPRALWPRFARPPPALLNNLVPRIVPAYRAFGVGKTVELPILETSAVCDAHNPVGLRGESRRGDAWNAL